MQAAEHNLGSAPAIVVGELVRPSSRRDVNLDYYEIGLVVQPQLFDVLITNRDVIVVAQVGGKRCEAERREERVFDRPKERARGFGKGRQDHLDSHRVGPSRLATLYQRDSLGRRYSALTASAVSPSLGRSPRW